VDHFCTSDLDYFCTSDENHVADFCASDLVVRWKPRVSFPFVGSGRPMESTCPIGALDLTVRSDHFHPSDPAVRSVPRGSFLCVEFNCLIGTTWVVPVHRIKPSNLCHVDLLRTAELAKFSATWLAFASRIDLAKLGVPGLYRWLASIDKISESRIKSQIERPQVSYCAIWGPFKDGRLREIEGDETDSRKYKGFYSSCARFKAISLWNDLCQNSDCQIFSTMTGDCTVSLPVGRGF